MPLLVRRRRELRRALRRAHRAQVRAERAERGGGRGQQLDGNTMALAQPRAARSARPAQAGLPSSARRRAAERCSCPLIRLFRAASLDRAAARRSRHTRGRAQSGNVGEWRHLQSSTLKRRLDPRTRSPRPTWNLPVRRFEPLQRHGSFARGVGFNAKTEGKPISEQAAARTHQDDHADRPLPREPDQSMIWNSRLNGRLRVWRHLRGEPRWRLGCLSQAGVN